MQGSGSGTGAHPVSPPPQTLPTTRLDASHQIHLHGHDFAILEQAENRTYDPANLNLKLDNPPRRDVVLLPKKGYVVIAFKADNPGIWLLHCHIARHASEGLALQIMERQGEAHEMFPWKSDEFAKARDVCEKWTTWREGEGSKFWEGDSGI
jgi:hypothetical protein